MKDGGELETIPAKCTVASGCCRRSWGCGDSLGSSVIAALATRSISRLIPLMVQVRHKRRLRIEDRA